MSAKQYVDRILRSVLCLGIGVASASVVFAGSAAADPLWPGGPDIPGVAPVIPGPLAPPAPVVAPCTAEGVKVCMRLSTNEAWVVDNGAVLYGPTPISHGRPGYETPPGIFPVAFKEEYHWSTMHNAEMRWAVFFNGDIATHIGPTEEQSHGCIRMTPDGAKAVYDHVNPGDIFELVV